MTRSHFVLSVVVATLDRYRELERCLDSLSPHRQTAVEPYEVVVIDQTEQNAHAGDIARRFPFANFYSTGRKGLSAARNFGVEKVQAEVVAFLDDDATADRRWVEEMAASFQAPDLEWVQICGGRVMADYGHHKKPDWLKPPLERFLSCIDFGDLPGPLQSNQWVVGANLAVRRRLLQTLGGFDAKLGRRGGTDLLSNEEAALVETVGRDHVLYNPAAMVKHTIPPERLTQRWFRKRASWQAVSDVLGNADFLGIRAKVRATDGDGALAIATVGDLYTDVADYECLERQLMQIYDSTSSSLRTGTLLSP
jgi:hypothetical protein